MAETTRTDRADALVARIEAATETEARRILADAEAEAAKIVQAAHAKARQRVHDEIVSLRRRRDESLRLEAARLETARRHLRQKEADAVVAAGLPALEKALASIWRDASGRRAWAEALVEAGAARLFAGGWVVDHPEAWPEDEKTALADRVRTLTGEAPSFETDSGLTAGLRLRRGGVCLDASAAALVGKPDEAGAAILAEVARGKEEGQ